jgi:hypothetical protein
MGLFRCRKIGFESSIWNLVDRIPVFGLRWNSGMESGHNSKAGSLVCPPSLETLQGSPLEKARKQPPHTVSSETQNKLGTSSSLRLDDLDPTDSGEASSPFPLRRPFLSLSFPPPAALFAWELVGTARPLHGPAWTPRLTGGMESGGGSWNGSRNNCHSPGPPQAASLWPCFSLWIPCSLPYITQIFSYVLILFRILETK